MERIVDPVVAFVDKKKKPRKKSTKKCIPIAKLDYNKTVHNFSTQNAKFETLNLFFPTAATLLYLSWLVQQKEGNLGEDNGKTRSTCCMVNRRRTRSDRNREISQQNFNNTLPPSSSFGNLNEDEQTRTRSYLEWPFATQLHSPV